ncbi:protein LYRIC-like isoform X2 [Entelurus aequoreus]|uniref:protein LYRIC-like isoform X2 n=1 Tax=Entelurus aequoreus TaxID=161455 RepID=UPI002B1DB989|nr:protein LYRIC-like isoform X2 [Entelurus aequoreus]
MAGDWRGFALLEEAELFSGCLRDLLSSGQTYVRSQFGLDLGLKPEQYPTWLMLTTAVVALLFLLAGSWAAVCGALLAGRRRPGCRVPHVGCEPSAKAPLTTKPAKPEEVKKRNQNKVRDKKTQQPNGQPASMLPEEVKVLGVLSKPPPQSKTQKAPEVQAPAVLVKKNKKKAKTSVKATHNVSTYDCKELCDDTWETKVSNREKRQQRRKNKGPESLGGTEGADAAKGHVEAALKVKKNRAVSESQRLRAAAKVDSPRAVGLSTRREVSSVNGGGWNNFSMKIPTQVSSIEASKFAADYQTQPEAQSWTQESQVAWSSIDVQRKSDLNPISFSMLRLNPAAKSMELQWTSHADADDEWGDINGVTPVDSTSDWNAPVEHWGNYEEPPVTVTVVQRKDKTILKKVSEDKDCEDPAGVAVKSKKKRKKKKRLEEEAASEAQVVNAVLKPQQLPALASKKPSPNSLSQKRTEQLAEASLKKKAVAFPSPLCFFPLASLFCLV